ncbi:protein O-mannosyl-transferase family [Herpetosiphon llansteffanensis]|uniref:protein O-mannosyl-transferase family n=1 Tax=Herpetosiphon llansteffanensis TaxID=2094568 RepID=UPI000D7D1706|nr:DUF2723 domain-containing protein [Herpetosiphon llansteffanensis]
MNPQTAKQSSHYITQPARQWMDQTLPWLIVGLLLPIYWLMSSPSISTAYGSSDSGELATALWFGAVPHPPGSPTYLLIGEVALHWFGGEPAQRLALLSGLVTALSAGIAAACVGLSASEQPRSIRWSAMLAAGLGFGLSQRIWQQALVVEVYALANLFQLLLLWLSLRWQCWQQTRTLAALGFVCGLGLGVQLPVAAWLVGFGLWWFKAKWPIKWQQIGLFLLMLLLGVSSYLVLPWRGAAVPQASWGDWRSFAGAISHISASEYRYLVGAVPLSEQLQRCILAFRDLLASYWWIVGPLLIGCGWQKITLAQRWMLIGWAGITLLWAISYGGADAQIYLLPIHGLAGWLLGLGVVWLAQKPRLAGWIWLAPMLMLICLPLGWHYSLRGQTQSRDQAIVLLQQQPANGQLLSNDDQTTFSAWYVQAVLGVRPDAQIIDQRLQQQLWYQRREGLSTR